MFKAKETLKLDWQRNSCRMIKKQKNVYSFQQTGQSQRESAERDLRRQREDVQQKQLRNQQEILRQRENERQQILRQKEIELPNDTPKRNRT